MLMTIKDLKRESQVSQSTWRTWLREGRLPVVRLGRSVRIDKQDFEKFIACHRVEERAS